MINRYSVLEDVVRETYIRIVWPHKIQEKQTDIYAPGSNDIVSIESSYECLERVLRNMI